MLNEYLVAQVVVTFTTIGDF